jgi:retron-type reverse transcriptase
MYYTPRWRGGNVASACARQVPVEAHVGSWRDYLRRHERDAAAATRADKQQQRRYAQQLLPRVADPRNLRAAWDYLARKGGQAPGLDHLRLDDLDDHEIWSWARTAREAILDGAYRPGPDRLVQIPKASGSGCRTISIPSVFDRVVQRAIAQMVQPYLDPRFLDTSLGYRPDKEAHHALALAETLMEQGARTVWITEDIRDAFDQVPQKRLLDILQTHLPHQGIMGLLENIVCTPSGRGIRQGGGISPLLLNVYLDHLLDRPWARRHPDTPLLRVADDLLILCRHWGQAQEAYQELRERLRPAAMPLKGTPAKAIWDLGRGQSATWLGYQLRHHQGRLAAGLASKAWTRLEQYLEELHLEPEAPLLVRDVLQGWLNYLGPCFKTEDAPGSYARVRRIATRLGFEEIDSLSTFRSLWQRANARWHRTRKSVRATTPGKDSQQGPSTTATP